MAKMTKCSCSGKRSQRKSLILFVCSYHEPVLGLVPTDCDLLEAGSGQVFPEFIRRVGMHAVDDLLPFLVVSGEAVVFIDDAERGARGHHAPDFGEGFLDVRPKIDGLERSDKTEGTVLERKDGDIGRLDFASAFVDGGGIDLGRFLHGDRGIVDAIYLGVTASDQEPGDIGATAATDIDDFSLLGYLQGIHSPSGQDGV